MKHILWLASWYPDEMSPYSGDFIQRHAFAVSQSVPLTVVYMAQHGPDVSMPEWKVEKRTIGQLKEIIVYFPYQTTSRPLLDKIRYNWKYYYYYRRFLRQYLADHGKPDLVHVHVPMKAGRMALWLKQKFGIPYFVSEHSSAYSDEVPDNYHTRSDYYRKWVKAIFEGAETVTTVSQKLGDRLQELFAIRNMRIIPNVVDTHFFNYSPNTPQKFRFLHASTMDHPKNVEGILKAFAALTKVREDWELIMLGWDNPGLKKLSSALGLGGFVAWKGVVTYKEVALEMKLASAFILLSRYENQPCVILESLCSGLPVIATAVGGIPEVVNDGNGMLIHPQNEAVDSIQLFENLLKFMEVHGKFDRPVIAQNAQGRFSYEAVGKEFRELYGKLASSE